MQHNKSEAIPYAAGFKLPTEDEVKEALGRYPWDSTSSRQQLRVESLLKDQPLQVRPDNEETTTGSNPIIDNESGDEPMEDQQLLSLSSRLKGWRNPMAAAMEHLDNRCYYSNFDSNGKPLWKALPPPIDEGSWLATVPEDGQTFDQYVEFITLRSGRFKPKASAGGASVLYICPLIAQSDQGKWPEGGPDLQLLSAWVGAFFGRKVVILDPVTLAVMSADAKKTDSVAADSVAALHAAKRRRTETARRIIFRTLTYESCLRGRVSEDGSRYQVLIDDLLSELLSIRENNTHTYRKSNQNVDSFFSDAESIASNKTNLTNSSSSGNSGSSSASNVSSNATSSSSESVGMTTAIVSEGLTAATGTSSCAEDIATIDNAFAVVGITMEDIYSSDEDLFVAGMAAGGSRVAVLSFARYHPRMKMHFQRWNDFGYAARSSDYSYFEEEKPRPKVQAERPVSVDKTSRMEYLRRAGKLVVHELAHIYGIDHCIYFHCLMNGTGHLVEDFAAPSHLCCVCLRKLQFRQGFDIIERYKMLMQVYKAGGLAAEVKWVRRRLNTLETNGQVS